MADYLQVEGAPSGAPVTRIFEFDGTFIENLAMLPDGRLLLTTFGSGGLYVLDPDATNPAAESLLSPDGCTGLSGIAALGDDKYAVSGGLHQPFRFQEGSMKVYIVSLSTQPSSAVVVDAIPVPDTRMMNGMVALPNKPHVILSADSLGGRILRVDTSTREASVAFTDAALDPSEDNPTHPLGVNGIRILGSYLYFANSSQGTFARFPIDDDGNKIGDVDIIARLEGEDRVTYAYDDFALDSHGNAYVAVHPSSVVKITPDGKQTTIAANRADLMFREPTSVLVAKDSKSIYVSTGGKTIGGKRYGGQIIQVDISSQI
ncbi:hypothetical protein F5Y13DRAFT_167191 [Hypoxylon sp. FL1857]|nr:hypothetical protein F5Y13DRAFT_167191 [Hypoxylon sp. FL1857]